MGFGNGPRIVTDGLVLSLDAADRNSYVSGSTVWNDVSGNNYSGSLINGPTFSNNSIVFDGVDDYIDCGAASTSIIRGTSQFTLNYWFKKVSSNHDFLLGTLDHLAEKGFFIQWFASDSNVYFGVFNGSRTYNYVNLPYNNNWLNFAFVFDGSLLGSTNIAKLYINSTQQSLTNSGGMPTSVPTNVLTFFIGKLTNYGEIAKGNLGNVLLYNRALSSTEILQNYNAQKSRFGL